jgi:hypothetical protein
VENAENLRCRRLHVRLRMTFPLDRQEVTEVWSGRLILCPKEYLRIFDKGTFEIKRPTKFDRKRPVVSK